MDSNELNSTDCPIKDILFLIKQADIEQLRESLLDLIHNSQETTNVYLYEHGNGVFKSKDHSFFPYLLSCRSKNGNCLENTKNVESDQNDIYFKGFRHLPTDEYIQVFAVEQDHASHGLLITTSQNFINEKYISALLDVYNNQSHLLRNKDNDSLTNLYNRHAFDEKINKLYSDLSCDKRSADNNYQYVFALLDIDFFKKVNDKYGHVYGDEVLILFSNIMKETFRDNDLLFRYGGEEFAVLLDSVSLVQAESILNRFRKNIENHSFPMENKVTTSIGYCEFNNKQPITIHIEHADSALYFVKENGRNQAASFENLIEDNKIKPKQIDEGDIELF
ncbi:MAG: GGDEF domain-containing protein [Woeseiaceae bacterium]